MSFTSKNFGIGFEAGYFLANDENCVRETRMASKEMLGEDVPISFIPAGTPYFKDGVYDATFATVEGLVYEDVDVSNGAMPLSVVTNGTVYFDRLPPLDSYEDTLAEKLMELGFKLINYEGSTVQD